MKIAVIGIGVMGSAIARRLIEQEAEVFLFNRTPEKAQLAAGAKGTVCQTIAAATKRADFIITSLNNADIVEQVVFGSNGIATGGSTEKLLIDMSSIDPERTRQLSERLKKDTGMSWIDSPLSGGASAAATGSMTLMLGGHPADIDKARPVLSMLSNNFTHLGDTGCGQTVKLVNQILCAISFIGVTEAVHFAEQQGVDASKIPDALTGGRADSRILQEFMMKIAKRDFSPTGRIDNMLKDLEAVEKVLNETSTELPLTSLVKKLNTLLVAKGFGASDSAEYIRLFDDNLLKGEADESKQQKQH